MRIACLVLAAVWIASPAKAEISSAYTEIDPNKDCAVYAVAEEGEGDWASMVCSGYRGYPVFVDYDDARESLFYGFPPEGEDQPVWESFAAFNSSGPRIEWRIETDGDRMVPFATIHRRFVSDPDNAERKLEVLVVSKVGQVAERDGCVIGLVMATGNPKANDMARRIADEQATTFACGTDERVQVGDNIAIPEFSRADGDN